MTPHASDYFLSAYLAPAGPASAHARRHDQNLALWQVDATRVTLRRCWELERLSGQKHHYWPVSDQGRQDQLIDGLLAPEGIGVADLAASWGTPGLPGYRAPELPAAARQFPLHTLAHLYSGLLMDSEIFGESCIVALAVDGAPDFTLDPAPSPSWYAGAVSVAGRVRHSRVQSPAPLYSAGQRLFRREPGTLMALASACRTAIEVDVARAVQGLALWGGHASHRQAADAFLRSLLEEAAGQLDRRRFDSHFTDRENVESAVMKVVQACCEQIMVDNITRLSGAAAIDPAASYLSVTGGFGLNCPANTRLLDRFGFRGLLTPPCPNDSGQAIGLGLLGLLGDGVLPARSFRLADAYHGRELSDVAGALADFAPWIAGVREFDADTLVADLLAGPLAWAEGPAEIGPRALGHRSLLADPRTPRSKEQLNVLKQRQWWRPVAPLALLAHARNWFQLDRPSPFMLEAAQFVADKADLVPAVRHLDGSARVQTLASDGSHLHRALTAFHAGTGVPLLCNTSLNDKDEPIVDTAREVLNFCVRKAITVAYLDGTRVELRSAGAGQAPPLQPHPRTHAALFAGSTEARDEAWVAWSRRGVEPQAMLALVRVPGLAAREPAAINRAAGELAASDPSFAAAAESYRQVFGPGARFAISWSPPHDPGPPAEPAGNSVGTGAR